MYNIITRNEQRDSHLKSEDFFKSKEFPKLTFVFASVKTSSNGEFLLVGDLTIRGATKPVKLTVEYKGTTKDPWGMERMGFDISGKISRGDYGLKWSALTEASGIVVGEKS